MTSSPLSANLNPQVRFQDMLVTFMASNLKTYMEALSAKLHWMLIINPSSRDRTTKLRISISALTLPATFLLLNVSSALLPISSVCHHAASKSNQYYPFLYSLQISTPQENRSISLLKAALRTSTKPSRAEIQNGRNRTLSTRMENST